MLLFVFAYPCQILYGPFNFVTSWGIMWKQQSYVSDKLFVCNQICFPLSLPFSPPCHHTKGSANSAVNFSVKTVQSLQLSCHQNGVSNQVHPLAWKSVSVSLRSGIAEDPPHQKQPPTVRVWSVYSLTTTRKPLYKSLVWEKYFKVKVEAGLGFAIYRKHERRGAAVLFRQDVN